MRCESPLCGEAATVYITEVVSRNCKRELQLCESHCREFIDGFHETQSVSCGDPIKTDNEVLFDLKYVISNRKDQMNLIYLCEMDGPRRLAFACGPCEAAAIRYAVRHDVSLRPLTHDVVLDTLSVFGAKLLRVVLYDRMQDANYFLAKLLVQQNDSFYEIGVRPSDAICLGIKGMVPVFVHERLLRA